MIKTFYNVSVFREENQLFKFKVKSNWKQYSQFLRPNQAFSGQNLPWPNYQV